MTRFVKGVTLTPEERQKAGLLPTGGGSGSTTTSTGIVKTHTCTVRMPDGSDCGVKYERYSPHYHTFNFAAPISQCLCVPERLDGGIPAIQQKAAALSERAFRQAQEEEQKQMRRKTPPAGRKHQPPQDPQMDANLAGRCAGKYAVCVKLASGRLLRIGPTYEQPEGAQSELHRATPAKPAKGQAHVIGICNRLERRWIEAKFLALLRAPLPEPDPVDREYGDEETWEGIEEEIADEEEAE